jgi:CBS domain-containing protein
VDVAAFLKRYPPFDALPPEDLDRIARSIQIEYFPAGTVIIQEAGMPAKFLYVVRKGVAEVVDDGRVLDLLDEGEAFGHLSLLSGLGPSATVRAHEDTICYLIDAELAEPMLGTRRGLAYVSRTLRRQLVRLGQTLAAERADPKLVAAGALVTRRPVTCTPGATVEEAAALMARERVSSLLVESPDGLGILTDRDLRTKVLAEGRPGTTPVAEIMSFPAMTVHMDETAAAVLAQMFERGIHHFPVVDADDGLIGVVTDTDLMRLERYSPAALRSAIERAGDTAGVAAAGRDLPRVVSALVDAGADPVDVGHVVGVAIDALTNRLIDLAMHELGSPPVPWAWLALGSAARHEQALFTDQDHALAYLPEGASQEEIDRYFAAFAAFVSDGLEAAGIPRCNGDAMASNPSMRRSLDGWLTAFRTWMDDPGMEGSILTSIVFDYRQVTGPMNVEGPLDGVIRTAPEHPIFLRHLARRALDKSPPTGFFRDLVVEAGGEHAGKLDVKHRGITLITNLARTYGVRAGSTERRTLGRLQAGAATGEIDRETHEGLAEAFRLLWRVRLEHQVSCVRLGAAPDDFVDPTSLGPVTRQALKQAFKIINGAQKELASDVGVRPR